MLVISYRVRKEKILTYTRGGGRSIGGGAGGRPIKSAEKNKKYSVTSKNVG